MSAFLSAAASLAMGMFSTRARDGVDTVMTVFNFTADSSPAGKAAPRRPSSKQAGNGIKKSRSRSPKKSAVSAAAALRVLSSVVEEAARAASHTPMEVISKAEKAFDNDKASFREHFARFELWRSEPSLASFDDVDNIAKEIKSLKNILDDFELADFSVPEEVAFVHAWHTWYLLEVEEFLEGNATREDQRELKRVVKRLVRVLRKAHRAACRLGI
ncbi:hypothetical protein P280DRAFT_522921 [Massarina eburnea CBS 473.64]|uniref:Uncharacterized protein n=1 Tax=Massarina eburnea CBS 473.64 TaxID=1395130 RepID=A0A6A6RJX4_9PLEO|nr:hypothetical protein P280DRAFT_522921 [Massarina eburnea CBS 473.64]